MGPADQTSWAELLKRYRHRAGLTKTAVARGMCVTVGYVSKLESGQRPPPEGVRDTICELLHLTADEAQHFHIRAELERTDPNAVKYLLRLGELNTAGGDYSEHSAETFEPDHDEHSLALIPIINKVAAGYPEDFTDLDYPAGIAEEYISVPDVADPNAFAFYVHGDSMEPGFPQGEILVASPNSAPFEGDPCFVRFSATSKVTGSTFKCIYFTSGGKIRLVSTNHHYREQVYDHHDVDGVWPVIRRYGRIPRTTAKSARRKSRSRSRTSGQDGGRASAAAG